MNMSRLRYFIEAARFESFSEAARYLHTSQPNLSKQIGALEEELDTKLFRRANRAVFLTPAGKLLYDETKDIPERMDCAVNRAKVIGKNNTKRLSIGILEGQNFDQVFADVVKKYGDAEPDVVFEIEYASFRQLRQGLERMKYDIVITLSFELPSFGGNVISEKIFNQYAGFAVCSKDKDRMLAFKSFADFKDENFVVISPEESPCYYERMIRLSTYCGFSIKIAREVSSLDSLMLCVQAGLGIAVLHRNVKLDRNYDIAIIPLLYAQPESVITVWRDENQNEHIKPFVEMLLSDCKRLLPQSV